jgi:E3 ubiquitin-protein ligase HERC4
LLARLPAAAADGEIYAWGTNDAGQLGIRQQRESAAAPARVEALESFTVHQVACGSSHTLAVVDDGALAAFGSNEFGQCGLGPLAGTQARGPGQLQPASGPR